MDRALLHSLGHGLLGFSALGMAALGFVWFTPGGSASAGGKTEGGWRLLGPVSYENLTVFPVVAAATQDTSALLTLEDGLASGDVIVREQGSDAMYRDRGSVRPVAERTGPSVNQLVLINRSKRPLLLLAGELVSGGKQDRIIAKDRIVAPLGDPLPLDVFCVEHGRWSAGAQFNQSVTIVHPSVREQAAVKQRQSEVWAAVAAGSTAPRVAAAPPPQVSSDQLAAVVQSEAPTSSYDKIYTSRRVGPSVDALVNEMQRRFRKETSGLKGERVVGVVVAYGGEVAWSDIFASGDLFDHYWNKLLRSYAVEAVARPALRERASADDALQFLQRLHGLEKTESEPGVYQWREINDKDLSQIELDSLDPKVTTVHRLVLRKTN